MKYILPLICLFLFNSCVINYDAETRLVFKTKFVDSNDQPVGGIDIEISVGNNDALFSNSEIISYGTSKEDGTLQLYFPPPDYDNDGISINSTNSYFEENGYFPFQLDNLGINDFENYELEIPKFYLLTPNESVDVLLYFATSSQNKQIVEVKIEGIYSPNNNNSVGFSNYLFRAKKNQTIQVLYKVKNNQDLIESFSQEVQINEENLETSIIY